MQISEPALKFFDQQRTVERGERFLKQAVIDRQVLDELCTEGMKGCLDFFCPPYMAYPRPGRVEQGRSFEAVRA